MSITYIDKKHILQYKNDSRGVLTPTNETKEEVGKIQVEEVKGIIKNLLIKSLGK